MARLNKEFNLRSYTIVECDGCEGECTVYCPTCEHPCDHDRMCRKCRGTGQYIEKDIGLMALILLSPPDSYGSYRTLAKAAAERERRYNNRLW